MEPVSLRVALAAAPALLAGSLRVLLQSERTQVVILLGPVTDRFDLAVVTPEVGFEVDADVCIVLDDGVASEGGGTVTDRGGTRRLPDLTSLMRYVEELAMTIAGSGQGER